MSAGLPRSAKPWTCRARPGHEPPAGNRSGCCESAVGACTSASALSCGSAARSTRIREGSRLERTCRPSAASPRPSGSGILAWKDIESILPLGGSMLQRPLKFAVAAVAVTVVATSAFAQRGGGIPVPPLPDGPIEYQTAEMPIRVRVLTRGLENPWSLAFLPDASILITERAGRLRHFRNGELSDPIPGMPDVVTDNFISGLHDIKLHPDFERNNLVYFVYNKASDGPTSRGGRVLTVARAVF